MEPKSKRKWERGGGGSRQEMQFEYTDKVNLQGIGLSKISF
jgi:hypothetical protein